MTDPASSGAAGAAAYKAVGGASAVAVGGAGLAAVVVMLMTPPRSPREWAVGLISTVVASIGGGAAVVEYFGLQHWVNSPIGLCAMGGLIFACGRRAGLRFDGCSTSSTETAMPRSTMSPGSCRFFGMDRLAMADTG